MPSPNALDVKYSSVPNTYHTVIKSFSLYNVQSNKPQYIIHHWSICIAENKTNSDCSVAWLGSLHKKSCKTWALDWMSTPAWDLHHSARLYSCMCVCLFVCLCACVCLWELDCSLTACWHVLIMPCSCCFWPWAPGSGSCTLHTHTHSIMNVPLAVWIMASSRRVFIFLKLHGSSEESGFCCSILLDLAWPTYFLYHDSRCNITTALCNDSQEVWI